MTKHIKRKRHAMHPRPFEVAATAIGAVAGAATGLVGGPVGFVAGSVLGAAAGAALGLAMDRDDDRASDTNKKLGVEGGDVGVVTEHTKPEASRIPKKSG